MGVFLATVLFAPAIVAPRAAAQETFQVEVGRALDPGDLTAESMRFYPSDLKVHQGDIIRFNTKSFHSVTLLPVGQSASTWIENNAGGIDKPWSVFLSDPDEGAEAVKANVSVMSPSGGCGWPTQAPCSFNGSGDESNGVVHSGLALFPTIGNDAEKKQLDFSVKVLADPGQSFDLVDVIHPAMTMRVTVVGEGEAASDPGTLEAISAFQFAADQEAGRNLHDQFKKKRTKKGKGKKTVWSAWAGIETSTVSLRRMYPRKLVIKKGHSVKWIFKKNAFSSHTVTFPTKKARKIAAAFPQVMCDQDGDFPQEGTESPDTPPTSGTPPFCDDWWQLELDVPRKLASSVGNQIVGSAKDLETSGVRGAGIAVDRSSYKLKFKKPSTRKGYSYICMIYEIAHQDMRGKVVVKR